MQLDIERLIADFGGPGQLAEDLNRLFADEPVTRAAIYKWRERGACRWPSSTSWPAWR